MRTLRTLTPHLSGEGSLWGFAPPLHQVEPEPAQESQWSKDPVLGPTVQRSCLAQTHVTHLPTHCLSFRCTSALPLTPFPTLPEEKQELGRPPCPIHCGSSVSLRSPAAAAPPACDCHGQLGPAGYTRTW